MFAALSAMGNTGCFVMPWVVGVAAEFSALNVALATSMFCPVVMVLLLLHLARGDEQVPAAAGAGAGAATEAE
jgi:hypothetical protein